MSKIYADTIETESPTVDITLGAAGDAVLIPTGATLKTNKIADAGGNNVITSNGSGTLTVNSGLGGAMKLLTTATADDSAYLSFETGIDSTYDLYIFKFININPVDANVYFYMSAATPAHGAGSWGVTKTSTWFLSRTQENGSQSSLATQGAEDNSNNASAQRLAFTCSNDSDSNLSGLMYLYNPSNTTYVKHYSFKCNYVFSNVTANHANTAFIAGYYDTTAAIDKLKFYFSSGNINEGKIKMYGISKSWVF